jgi:hypothetical protein
MMESSNVSSEDGNDRVGFGGEPDADDDDEEDDEW